jgi:hypothetical protein
VSKSTNVYYHIEGRHAAPHLQARYDCELCGKAYRSRNSYNVHMSTYHKHQR